MGVTLWGSDLYGNFNTIGSYKWTFLPNLESDGVLKELKEN